MEVDAIMLMSVMCIVKDRAMAIFDTKRCCCKKLMVCKSHRFVTMHASDDDDEMSVVNISSGLYYRVCCSSYVLSYTISHVN